jgi:resuscitation-promoting factor RpfB
MTLLVAVLFVTSLFAFTTVGAENSDKAKNGRLITIHDRGQEKVILTHARTISDALQDGKISINPEDEVEPALDSELVATDYTVNIYRARPVVVVDGMVRQKIMTAAQTPANIAEAANVTLQDQDKTVLGVSDDIVTDGASTVLTIDRATEFTLNLYGTSSQAYSQEKTVGDMLAKKNITLGPDDSLSIDASKALIRGMVVEVWRNGTQTATVEEPIAFSVRKIQDADQPAGYRKVQTPGVDGRKNVTYEITMQNGKEVSRKMIQSVTLEEPKEQVEVVGAKPSFSGDFAAALAKLRACEAGGNYANKNNPLYRGAYQFSYSTWGNKYGIYDPADATPAQQDQAARELYVRRGWQPWPHCGSSLPDIYR